MCYSMHMYALYAMLLFEVAEAGQFQIPGANLSAAGIITSIVNLLWGAIVAFCTVIFAIGALFMILGAGKEDMLQKGKTMMIGGIAGLVVVIGGPSILRTFFKVFE
ncbi:hypothetical protein A3H90_03765 [Candidatus Peribacteria bacterium RIFCSPLOWO2_02_FULL_55_36]|nr:MAG: hypothetical protein A3H90_03765 [Candidatus Peribacteria bacterium RIFCSPLOWO2_02_FULL_55_36]